MPRLPVVCADWASFWLFGSPPALADPTQPMPSVPALRAHHRTVTGDTHKGFAPPPPKPAGLKPLHKISASAPPPPLLVAVPLLPPATPRLSPPDSKALLKTRWGVATPGSPVQLGPGAGGGPGAGAAPGSGAVPGLRCRSRAPVRFQGSGVAPAPPSARRAARTRGGGGRRDPPSSGAGRGRSIPGATPPHTPGASGPGPPRCPPPPPPRCRALKSRRF